MAARARGQPLSFISDQSFLEKLPVRKGSEARGFHQGHVGRGTKGFIVVKVYIDQVKASPLSKFHPGRAYSTGIPYRAEIIPPTPRNCSEARAPPRGRNADSSRASLRCGTLGRAPDSMPTMAAEVLTEQIKAGPKLPVFLVADRKGHRGCGVKGPEAQGGRSGSGPKALDQAV